MVYLSPHGSAEATKRCRDAIAQHRAGQTASTTETKDDHAPTAARVVADCRVWATGYYRDVDGNLSGEVTNLRHACVPLLHVLRDRLTDSLTCADLHAVRDHSLSSDRDTSAARAGAPSPALASFAPAPT